MRRFFSILWVAFALGVSQQATLLHDLGHAVKRIHAPSQDQYPASDTCDKCFGFSQLSGAAPGGVHALALAADSLAFTSFAAIVAPSRTVVATRSRAPPAVL